MVHCRKRIPAGNLGDTRHNRMPAGRDQTPLARIVVEAPEGINLPRVIPHSGTQIQNVADTDMDPYVCGSSWVLNSSVWYTYA